MRRAFVIQLDCTAADKQFKGRIEHVDTGQSRHFESLVEAVNFARNVLSKVELDEQEIATAHTQSDVRSKDE